MVADGGRILIVEDEPDLRSLLHQVLAPPHHVVLARDGMVACAKLETAPFDVVLTDVRMPGPSGFELARLIKAKWPLTEVVLMTAFGSPEAASEALRLGAYGYMSKPFPIDDLILVITRALERRRERVGGERSDAAGDDRLATLTYREAMAQARDRGCRDYLAALLKRFAGNVPKAAAHGGLKRESLHRLLRRYGLRPEDFRDSDTRPQPFKTTRLDS
jgi:DNA-binding NtrC family response regulator